MSVCEKRDVKGLYQKARNRQLQEFTGIDSIYEVPKTPDIHVHTEHQSLDEITHAIMQYLKTHAYM
jgi:adenylylsulfate kinase-like enzyme